MTKLEKKLRTSLRKLNVTKADRILVAVSGGADSTALLDALVRWKKADHLFIAHLNHQLRGAESDADETYVQAWAARLALPVFLARENVSRLATQEKKNLEATARRIRYEFLLRTANECQANVIVTAHTRNDQVETVLLRLLRGTSAAGLQGIHATMELAPTVRLVRPMLDITRAEVLEYCTKYQLAFCHDSSNLSLDFTRNRIRQELLPLLATYNPAIEATLLRFAAQCSEDDEQLQAEARKWVQTLADGSSLKFKPLLELSPAVRRRVLRQWLQGARGDLRRISTAHLQSLDDLTTRGEGGSYVELPGQQRVYRLGPTLKLQPAPESARN